MLDAITHPYLPNVNGGLANGTDGKLHPTLYIFGLITTNYKFYNTNFYASLHVIIITLWQLRSMDHPGMQYCLPAQNMCRLIFDNYLA